MGLKIVCPSKGTTLQASDVMEELLPAAIIE
jgi:hypothetical protein